MPGVTVVDEESTAPVVINEIESCKRKEGGARPPLLLRNAGAKPIMRWPFHELAKQGGMSQLEADAFPGTVPGIAYDGRQASRGGVPLGGLGTGFIELRTDARLGAASIYNRFCPPETYDAPLWYTRVGGRTSALTTSPPVGVPGIRNLIYWGHYPMADLVGEIDQNLDFGVRAWAPFVMGDSGISNTPAAGFEIRLHNQGDEELTVDLAMVMPGPDGLRGFETYSNGDGPCHLSVVRADGGHQYALGVLNRAARPFSVVQSGATHGEADAAQASWTQEPAAQGSGTGLAVQLHLAPGATESVRFVAAWYSPHFKDSGGEPHRQRYARRFASVIEVLGTVASGFDTVVARIAAQQQVIYDADLPAWMKDALVNTPYSLARNTMWAVSDRPDDWYDPEGLFVHSESFTGCPITETMVCRMHGHFPALFFFPELERSTLHAFDHFQRRDGEIPFSFGQPTSLRDPRYSCQHPLNSSQYIQMVWRYFLRSSDTEELSRRLDSVKAAVDYLLTLDCDGDGLVNDHSHTLPGEHWPANQFYDQWPWFGTSSYVAGTWLAALACAHAIGAALQDTAFRDRCKELLERGTRSFEDKLWNGQYYRLYNDADGVGISNISLANQLMVVWCTRVAGLPDILPQEHLQAALASIGRLNNAATKFGFVNGVRPSGDIEVTHYPSENDHAANVFIGECMCTAMTFLYLGDTETGLEAARRMYFALADQGCLWNQYCLISSADGHPVWGSHYYSDMVQWVLPMALAGQDVGTFCAEGGLVSQTIKAGRAGGASGV